MNKLKFNPDNAKYYSEDFIKGFECGVERQFNADVAENTAEWKDGYCSNCGCDVPAYIIDWKWQKDMSAKYCPNCGRRMLGEQTE